MTTTRQIMRRHNTGLVCCRIYLFSICLAFLIGLLSVVFITVPLRVERPLCNDILFNSGSPAVIDLPPFNASHVRIVLPDPNYFLDYQEEVDDNGNLTFTICVNNSISLNLVCMNFDSRKTAICRPSDYPQCLPAAFDSGRQGSNPAFGVSIINVESNVTVYHIKAIYPSKVYSETLTWQNINDLKSIWFAGLNCSLSWLLVVGIVLGGCTVVLCLLLALCALRMSRRRRRPVLPALPPKPKRPALPPKPKSEDVWEPSELSVRALKNLPNIRLSQTYRPTSHRDEGVVFVFQSQTARSQPDYSSSQSIMSRSEGESRSLSQTYRPTSHRTQIRRQSGYGSLTNPLAGPLTVPLSVPSVPSLDSSAARVQLQQPRLDAMSPEQTPPLEPDPLHPPRLTPALVPSVAASLEDSGKPIRSIQEVQLDNLCWIPFEMDSFKLFKSDRKEAGSFSFIPVRNLTSHLYTSSKDEEEILLEWSEEHLTPNALTTVTYAVIADGPFDLPPGFPKRCSMVVYVVTEGDDLKEPLCLHLPHWSKFEDSSSLTCLRAPHTLVPGHTHYSFEELDKDNYNIYPSKCIVKVDGRNCLFAVARRNRLRVPLDRYQYQVLERKLSIHEKELRIFITFGTDNWRQIVRKFCKKNEETEWDISYAIPWTIDRNSDVLKSSLKPASQGQGWTVSVFGLDAMSVEGFDFTKKASIGYARSLQKAVETGDYPHAFRYKVVQNEVPPGANTRIVTTNIVLEPTHPCPVTIPLSMVEHDPSQAKQAKVEVHPPVVVRVVTVTNQQSTPDKPGPSPPTPLVPPPLDYPSLHTYIEPLITHEWERFAINLGVTVAMKERIRKDCLGRSEVACKEVLIRWLAGEEGTGRDPRTWSTVLKAVRETGFPDVADELQKRFSLVDEDDQK